MYEVVCIWGFVFIRCVRELLQGKVTTKSALSDVRLSSLYEYLPVVL